MIIGILVSFSGCKNDNEVTGVTVLPAVCVLKVGEFQHLTAFVTPENADDKTVRWSIQTKELIAPPDADTVASISENGKVTGLAEGFATAVCITNNMFYEATAKIIVGYAVAVKGIYNGSLSKNGDVINPATKIGIDHISEYEARFGLPFLDSDNDGCPVTVERWGESMKFSGNTTINLNGSETPVEVSGTVTLLGGGDFTILVGGNPATKYSFLGTIDNRPSF